MSKNEQNALVDALKKGSDRAFEKFVAVFGNKITGMAYNFFKDIGVAEDIAQNVFLKVFQKISLFRGDSQLSSWVYRITINEIYMHFRKKKKDDCRGMVDNKQFDSAWCRPEEDILERELNTILLTSLQKLEEKEKVVFIFRDIEEMTTNEVCEAVNTTIPTVKSRLLRGRRRLRKSNIGRYLLGEEIYLLSKGYKRFTARDQKNIRV